MVFHRPWSICSANSQVDWMHCDRNRWLLWKRKGNFCHSYCYLALFFTFIVHLLIVFLYKKYDMFCTIVSKPIQSNMSTNIERFDVLQVSLKSDLWTFSLLSAKLGLQLPIIESLYYKIFHAMSNQVCAVILLSWSCHLHVCWDRLQFITWFRHLFQIQKMKLQVFLFRVVSCARFAEKLFDTEHDRTKII